MGTFLIQEQLFVWEYQWDLSVWDFMLSYSYIKKSPQSYHVTMLCLISPAPHILEQIFSYKYIFLYIKQILFNLCTYTVFFYIYKNNSYKNISVRFHVIIAQNKCFCSITKNIYKVSCLHPKVLRHLSGNYSNI